MPTLFSDKCPSRRIARIGILLCLSLGFSYLEFLMPAFLPLPGCKPGFANIVITFCACFCGLREALLLSLLRVCLSSLLFANITGLVFSLAGALCAYIVLSLFLLLRPKNVSILGVSVASAAAHNAGQLLAASVVLGYGLRPNTAVFSYFPALLCMGALTGTITGLLLYALFPALRRAGFSMVREI